MLMKCSPSNESMRLFRDDLWKDQRKLDMVKNHEEYLCLQKHYVNETEAHFETEILQFMSEKLVNARVPKIISYSEDFISLEYLKGIRVFNLFVELDDHLPPEYQELGRHIKKRILKQCERDQQEIQQALIDWNRSQKLKPYPQEKLMSIITFLADCLNVKMPMNEIKHEIELLCSIFETHATVPFRDATTKNMVLVDPDLWQGNHESEDSRREFIVDSIAKGTWERWLSSPIYNFDFASCINLTTPEDDVISLKHHERTCSGFPQTADELIWFGEANPERAAISFLLRYYRFGGRKAAYKLVHYSGHHVRFRFDHHTFYFNRIHSVMSRLWPESERAFRGLLKLTDVFAKQLKIERDPFDNFRELFPELVRNRKYYTDMFPE